MVYPQGSSCGRQMRPRICHVVNRGSWDAVFGDTLSHRDASMKEKNLTRVLAFRHDVFHLRGPVKGPA